MADQFDEFLEEVQQDIKQEKYLKLWKKYGRYASTAAVSLLAAAALSMFWQNYQKKKQVELSDAFFTAQNYIAQNRVQEAFAILDAMKANDQEAYGYLRNFQKAALLLSKDNKESKQEAIALYQKLANDGVLPLHIKEYATFLLAKTVYDSNFKKPEEVIEMLSPLCDDKKPWRFFALELTGLILYKQGKYKESLEVFAALVKQENLPEGLRMRCQMMVQLANQNVQFKS